MYKIYSLLSSVILIACIGCGTPVKEIGTPEKIIGKAEAADGSALSKVIVVLQPAGDGYMREYETDASGKFEAEILPGKYYYFFKSSKGSLPKSVPAAFQEVDMSRTVEVSSKTEVVCKVQ
jgi:hypothetical protein